MADRKIENLIVNGNVATWTMKIDGDIEGTYMGTFKFRCFLTPIQKIDANREYRELLGANPTMAGEHESFLAYALSELKQRVIESPPFWESKGRMDGGDISDDSVISEVLNAAIEAELQYRNQIREKKLEAIKKAKEAAEAMLTEKEEKEDESESEEGGN